MGAFIATALAAQNPELVAGLNLDRRRLSFDMPVGADAEQVLDTVLAQRITQLQETYPSREVYRGFGGNAQIFRRRIGDVDGGFLKLRGRW